MPAAIPAPAQAPPALQDAVFVQWPELAARLGERREAFAQAARERAGQYGLADEGGGARFLNLCLAFGPSFETRPEHEWALATLRDPRLGTAVRLHQLVRRAEQVLARAGGPAERLRAGDEALLDKLEEVRRNEGAEPPLVARRACDLEAVQVAVLAACARMEYAPVDGNWLRRPRPGASAPLVADSRTPLPDTLHVLAESEPDRVTQLQVRQRPHATCGGHHPQLAWIDDRGIQRWRGHAAQGVTWPLRPAPARLAADVAIAQEAEPVYGVIELDNCAIRDEGVPTGPQRARVGIYPAEQWLFTLRREGGAAVRLPAAEGASPATPAVAAGRYHLERDGQALHAPHWADAFDAGLPRALAQGLATLFEAWKERVADARLDATEHLAAGEAAWAWGWREGPLGLAAPPVFEVRGELDQRLALSLELRGEVKHGNTSAALRLQAGGEAPLRVSVHRTRPDQDLLALLLAARARARWPFDVACDAIVSPEAAVWRDAGPCTGALVVEAGLRPRQAGSGWQYFVQVDLEPVTLPFTVHDPVVGETSGTLALLPAQRLLDWSTP